VIRKRIRRNADGIDVAADVNAVIAVNEGGESTHTSVSSRQKVVQRSGRRPQKEENQQQSPPERED
jgi:hypothetical protein